MVEVKRRRRGDRKKLPQVGDVIAWKEFSGVAGEYVLTGEVVKVYPEQCRFLVATTHRYVVDIDKIMKITRKGIGGKK